MWNFKMNWGFWILIAAFVAFLIVVWLVKPVIGR